MVEGAQKSPPGAHGLVFHPFLAGQVTPYYDMLAKGSFIGLGLHHDRPALMRALLEGCANEMRAIVDTFQRDMVGGVDELRLTGGGTKSIGFVQIMADVIGMQVSVLKERECTALGAAILGAVGAGQFSSVEDAVKSMVHIETSVSPNTELSDLYDEQHAIFRSAYESLAQASVFKRLNALNERSA
jgi:xylulokinase